VPKAQALAAALASELATEPQAYGKILEGDIALKKRDVGEAIKILTAANGVLDTWLGHFDLGRAYLEGRAYAQADSEFDRCIKRRGEALNWYSETFERRAQMMREHGMIGRHYAGKVTQIISGSIGFDDWEWGVDLYAPDPVTFKKLIYEMRFDEASAKFAEFGPFYTGVHFSSSQLGALLAGQVPALEEAPRT